MKLTTEEKTSVFLALYIAVIIAIDLMGGKLTVVFGQEVSVAILALPFVYVILNATNEVFGQKLSRRFVLSALAAQILIFAIVAISLWLPAGQSPFGPGFTAAYNAVFQTSLRIIVASLIAFLVGQYYAIWIFNVIKHRTHGKLAWLRYNLTTISWQFIDTFLFMFIGFYTGNVSLIVGMALLYFLFKVLATLISTPFFYAGARWLLVKNATPPDEPMAMTVRVSQNHKARI
jgi:hypothetical protein